jgi:hypothetical protein
MAIPEARTAAASYVDEYGVSIISAKIPCGGRDIACSSQEPFSSAFHSDRALKSYLCIEDSFAIITGFTVSSLEFNYATSEVY